jgi:hypothetical protein
MSSKFPYISALKIEAWYPPQNKRYQLGQASPEGLIALAERSSGADTLCGLFQQDTTVEEVVRGDGTRWKDQKRR